VTKDLLSVSDLSREEIESLIEQTLVMKRQSRPCLLSGKVLALLFEKPSLRTRVSFEVAMHQLDGRVVYLSQEEVGLGKRELVSDVARVLSRYVDCIAARTFFHETLDVLARYSAVPVINALSNLEHPCQALSDLLTIYEKKGKLAGLTLAFVGDGNNVANSLLLAASLTGMNFSFASPASYGISQEISNQAREFARLSGSEIRLINDPFEAVKEADVVYTDVWTSMGQEAEAEKRRLAFCGYQVDDSLLCSAKEDALFMHPLPAHRGEEIAAGVLESGQSVVFDQAENRLHLQKALLAKLLLPTD
jgi:ornithine carbamoyltransferase